MPDANLAQFLVLPALLMQSTRHKKETIEVFCTKQRSSLGEICPRCAQRSFALYDSRVVRVRDEPLRKASGVVLVIRKHRYYCKACRKPFTEPVAGILPKQRTTQRFKRTLLWATERFSSLKDVKNTYRCSNSLIYKTVFEQLELKCREYNYPWPSAIGIDEHFFSRSQGHGKKFFTIFTDLKKHRVREAVLGKARLDVQNKISHIEGRERVRWAVIDMSDTYRSLVINHFPNAEIVADKFHVLRLLGPALRRRRIEITGDRRTLRIKRLLQKNRHRLNFFDKQEVDQWLEKYPELDEIYRAKERLHEFYRTKGFDRAVKSFDRMITMLEATQVTELKTLLRTLKRWKTEILNYFKTGLTNAMTEGFNRVASLVKNRAFGYKNPNNYRLRYLSACRRS
jgi:transposase